MNTVLHISPSYIYANSRALHLLAATLIAGIFITFPATAARVVAVDPTNNVSGTTATYEGTTFTFTDGAGKYSTVTDAGTDRTATIADPPGSIDFYIQNASLSLDTRIYRYAQVFYSLSSDFSGSTHSLYLDTSVQSPAFATFTSSNTIPASTGSHSFVIDLFDGTDLATGSAGNQYSGNITQLRWDWWNNAGNNSKAFTLDKVIFGSKQSASIVLPSEYGFESPLADGSLGGTLDGGFVPPSPSAWTWAASSGICRNTGARMTQSGAAGGDTAPEGVQAAFLLGNGAEISQTVSGFTRNATYALGFDSSGRETASGGAMEFRVLIGGTVLTFSGANSVTPAVDVWNAFKSDNFKAPNSSFSLSFDGINITNGTMSSYIDYVRFYYVADPPPSGTLFLFE